MRIQNAFHDITAARFKIVLNGYNYFVDEEKDGSISIEKFGEKREDMEVAEVSERKITIR